MARTDLYRKIQAWIRTSHLDEQQIANEVSRRQLLGESARLLALSSLPLAACVKEAKPTPQAEIKAVAGEDVDGLIIIGGGLAGLTAAYTLAKAGLRVRVYEGSERFGGRIATARNFNKDGMFCERGGEFVDTGHEDLIALAKELGLELQALKDPSSKLLQEVYFFGGRMRRESEIIKGFRPLGRILRRDMKKLMVNGEVQIPTYRETLGEAAIALDRLSLEEYLSRCKNEVDAWIRDLVRIAYVGEYGLEASSQSALNLLLLIDPEVKDGLKIFGESDEAFRIQGGNETLIQSLLAKLKEMQVPLLPQHQLIGIKESGQGLTAIFSVAGRTLEVSTRELVLALPQPILATIEGLTALDLSPVKKASIAELGFGTNSKFMLGFSQRYWQEKHPNFKPNEGAIYTESESQAYWDSSRGQTGQSGILTNFLGGKAGLNISPGSYAKTLDDLEKIMPGIKGVHDGQKLLQHWASSPWARGSYMCPKPGQYTSLIGAAGESELGGALHFIGEHCSVDYGGYMNGAVASGLGLAKILIEKAGVEAKKAS